MKEGFLTMHYLWILLSVAVVLTLFIIAFLTLWFNRNHAIRPPQYLLASYLISGAYILFVVTLIESRLILDWPHFHKTGIPLIFLCLPLSNLYLRKSATGESMGAKDAVHFVIPFFCMLCYLPYYLSSTEEKLETIKYIYENGRFLFIHGDDGGFNNFLILILGMFAWYVINNTIWLLRIWKPDYDTLPWRNESLKKWLSFFFLITQIQPLVNIILLISNNDRYMWQINWTAMVLLAILVGVAVMTSPGVLYGIQAGEPPINDETDACSVSPKQDDLLVISTNKELGTKLEKAIHEGKVFLFSRLSAAKLAEDLHVEKTELEEWIDEKYGLSFSDYINLQKVEHIMNEFRNGSLDGMTLEEIAKSAGFGNRTTFVKAFKKFKGDVPSNILSKQRMEVAKQKVGG